MTTSTDKAETPRGGRPARRRRTDERIATAVMGLLRASGPDAVTMEAVQAASGVSRSTLYGRYTDRYQMLEAVARQVAGQRLHDVVDVDRPMSQQALGDVLDAYQEIFSTQLGSALGHLLSGSEGFMAVWRENLVTPRINALKRFFNRGVHDGVLRGDVDYELVIEWMLGGMVAAGALHGHIPHDWAGRTAATLWPAISNPGPAT